MSNKLIIKEWGLNLKNAIAVSFLIFYLVLNWNPKKVKGA